MGHSRLLSKLANLLRKTCIKIGRDDTRLAPGDGPDRADGCHFGSAVSIVATRQRGEQHVVVCLTVMGWVCVRGRRGRVGRKITGGQKKPLFTRAHVESELREERKNNEAQRWSHV